MSRIVMGMSGGVDSSLAAVLLKERGFEVVGVSMKLWPCGPGDGEDPEDACCSPTDARAVALLHGIPHYVVDFEAQFAEGVVNGFLEQYRAGLTPNPCIKCNENVKFNDLWHYADQIRAERVGTGHYARIVEQDGRLCPATPRDLSKDQTYFLFTLKQEQLRVAEFPLGDLTKSEVRQLAADRNLHNAEKDESMDLCFVGEQGLQEFLREKMPDAFVPGPIVLQGTGEQLGEHRGVTGYTIGQRRGLGIGYSEPLYVTEINVATNTLTVGVRSDLYVSEAKLTDCHWHLFDELPAGGLHCKVRNRHHGVPIPATVVPSESGAIVRYHKEVMRPSPGQACVAYDDDVALCLGGGFFALG